MTSPSSLWLCPKWIQSLWPEGGFFFFWRVTRISSVHPSWLLKKGRDHACSGSIDKIAVANVNVHWCQLDLFVVSPLVAPGSTKGGAPCCKANDDR